MNKNGQLFLKEPKLAKVANLFNDPTVFGQLGHGLRLLLERHSFIVVVVAVVADAEVILLKIFFLRRKHEQRTILN